MYRFANAGTLSMDFNHFCSHMDKSRTHICCWSLRALRKWILDMKHVRIFQARYLGPQPFCVGNAGKGSTWRLMCRYHVICTSLQSFWCEHHRGRLSRHCSAIVLSFFQHWCINMAVLIGWVCCRSIIDGAGMRTRRHCQKRNYARLEAGFLLPKNIYTGNRNGASKPIVLCHLITDFFRITMLFASRFSGSKGLSCFLHRNHGFR